MPIPIPLIGGIAAAILVIVFFLLSYVGSVRFHCCTKQWTGQSHGPGMGPRRGPAPARDSGKANFLRRISSLKKTF